ncbi:MAG: NAD(P)/FAD-dependent oxidoreductase [Candidatus Heimdallarchaeota archaeon]
MIHIKPQLTDIQWDAIIVGAGIIGCSTAYHIKKKSPELNVLLIDKQSSAGYGNSIHSTGMYRNVFESPTNKMLTDSSIGFYKYVERELGFDLGLKEIGYLFLEPKTRGETLISKLKQLRIDHEVYSSEDLVKLLPGIRVNFDAEDNAMKTKLNPINIAYGILGKKCGRLDPYLVAKFYENEFRKEGGITRYRIEVTSILLGAAAEDSIETTELRDISETSFPVWIKPKVRGITFIDKKKDESRSDNRNERRGKRKIESTFLTKSLILCTGAWINQLLDPIGIDSQIKPKKRQLFNFCYKKDSSRSKESRKNLLTLLNNENFNELGTIPLIILPMAGIHIKPEKNEGCVTIGCADNIGRRFEPSIGVNEKGRVVRSSALDEPIWEEEFYVHSILPILNLYFPNIFGHYLRSSGGDAGYYAISPDGFPVVEKDKSLGNLIYVSGLSGSGIMKADAIGRIVGALFGNEEEATLYNGEKFRVSNLGKEQRNIQPETIIL